MYQMRIRTTIQSATILAGSSPIRELLCFTIPGRQARQSPFEDFWSAVCWWWNIGGIRVISEIQINESFIQIHLLWPEEKKKYIYITITSTQGILIMPQHSHKHVLESDVGIISSLSRQRWGASQVVDAVESKYASINVYEKTSIYTQGTSYSGHSLYPPTYKHKVMCSQKEHGFNKNPLVSNTLPHLNFMLIYGSKGSSGHVTRRRKWSTWPTSSALQWEVAFTVSHTPVRGLVPSSLKTNDLRTNYDGTSDSIVQNNLLVQPQQCTWIFIIH